MVEFLVTAAPFGVVGRVVHLLQEQSETGRLGHVDPIRLPRRVDHRFVA